MYTHPHLHRLYPVAAIWCLAAFAAGPVARAQVGLGIAPMRLELIIPSGTQRSGSVSVSNDSSGPVRVRAQLMDFFIDTEGDPQFAPAWPAEASVSCRRWLTLNPMEIDLKRGEQVQVRYTMRVPEGAERGSYQCAAGFTTLPIAGATAPLGLRMAVRVVAAFYAIVGSSPAEGAVKDVRLEETREGDRPGRRGVVILQNRGNTYFRAAGDLSLLTPQGQLIESVPYPGIPVLPKREQRFLFRFLTPLAPGSYVLRSRVDIGANEIQEVVVPVLVEPPKP